MPYGLLYEQFNGVNLLSHSPYVEWPSFKAWSGPLRSFGPCFFRSWKLSQGGLTPTESCNHLISLTMRRIFQRRYAKNSIVDWYHCFYWFQFPIWSSEFKVQCSAFNVKTKKQQVTFLCCTFHACPVNLLSVHRGQTRFVQLNSAYPLSTVNTLSWHFAPDAFCKLKWMSNAFGPYNLVWSAQSPPWTENPCTVGHAPDIPFDRRNQVNGMEHAEKYA